jgi:type IV secretion system protein VirD4
VPSLFWVIFAAVLISASLVLVHRVTISKAALTRHRAWAMRHRISLRLRPGPGFATVAELWLHWSKLAAVSHGHRARPSLRLWEQLRRPATNYAVRFGRAQLGTSAFGRMQDQVLILAPPQSGKSGLLADRILDHPGPVVCTSTRADLFVNTAGQRARRGPVATFNPLGVGGIASTFGWNIIEGCEGADTAIRRAQDLTGDYPTGDMKWWQCKASAALAALLHAAGLLPGATILDVHAWVHRHGDAVAEDILETAPLASRALRSVLAEIRQLGKTADSVRATISESLTWVAVDELAAAVTPALGDGFDVGEFVRRNGTLYMIAPGTETAPIAPLFQAFVQHVHYEAGLIGSKSPAGKLDPPLWLALDELTQVCPLPLPSILADSAGKGILVAAVVHSLGQLETRWGRPGAETVWATCGTKILLSGITDPGTLEHVSRLCGQVGVRDSGGLERVPAMPPELLRLLPRWRALVLTLNNRPLVVKTRPVWHRLDRRFGRIPAPLPALKPAIQATVTVPTVDAATIRPAAPVANGSVSNGHHRA